ncbi:MAG: 2-hydroxyacyl-CoA dehydratase family protein [Verrucomicrobiae bacterium]|nr:2-hydroxyacyl-CoA dehydratase family protein [Verrucomicrobiae bacterium]
MKKRLSTLTLDQWDGRYRQLKRNGLKEPSWGGSLRRHLRDNDQRLRRLRFDPSPAALHLWNFLLTEEDRLRQARADGRMIVGVMKDLGTVPVMAYALSNVVAFYPDGAWWIPCLMEQQEDCLALADSLGVTETFCPVRAMLGAFLNEAHFPSPDLLICSAGATCDDFSAIVQRLEGLGRIVHWWEIPYRRPPVKGEKRVLLPGGAAAPASLVAAVRAELQRIRRLLAERSGQSLDDAVLSAGIRRANRVRHLLGELRRQVFGAPQTPLPALEMLIAEMLAIHFCSDFAGTERVLKGLLREVKCRVREGKGFQETDAARIFWVNPVADLRVMNLAEAAGGRICGTDYMFTHALDTIPVELPPMEALARMALSDPMAGLSKDRAARIARDVQVYGAEAVVISRIPGASHCASEGRMIGGILQGTLDLPVIEIEAPSISDSLAPHLRTRLEALVETVKQRRLLQEPQRRKT